MQVFQAHPGRTESLQWGEGQAWGPAICALQAPQVTRMLKFKNRCFRYQVTFFKKLPEIWIDIQGWELPGR